MRKPKISTPREMSSLFAFAALTGGIFACTSPVIAATYTQTYEGDSTSNYSPLKGRNSEGSVLEISSEKAHEGKQSLKLAYKSSGYIEFTINQVEKVAFVGDKLYMAFWVYGTGRRDFVGGGIRILDANNETMQFDIPGFAEAMAGEGWREVRAEIDLTKIGPHWGDNSDGKLDRPFGYLGLAATRNGNTEATGTVYIDDLRLSDAPIPTTPNGAAPAVAQNPVAPVGGVPVGIPNVGNVGANVSLAPVFTSVTGPASPFLKWVSAPGKAVEFQSSVTVPNAAQSYVVNWKVRDAFNNIVAEGKEPLAAGTPQKNFSFRVENPPKGVLYATALLMNAREEVVAEAKTRAAVFTPRGKAVPVDTFIWGVAAHVGRDNGRNAPDEIALMRLLGFAAARSDMTWNSIQPKPDVWDWTSHDKIYDNFEREGIMPMPLLSYSTQWATTGNPASPNWKEWYFTPPKTEPFLKYTQEAIKRYGHQANYWEIWNEPDIDFWLGTVEQYTALVDAVVPTVKAVQPNAQIMNGGFSETKRRPDFIPTYLKTVKNRPDIYAIHTHGAFENLLRAETTVNNDLAAAGLVGAKRPKVFLNEAGFSNVRNTESEQAIQLVKKMSYAPAAGFGSYIWYDLRDDGTDPNENEHNFGLVKNDYAPKASAVAVNTLLDTIGTRKFSKRLALNNGGYGLIYQGAGQTILTAWRQSQAKGDAILPLVVRAKSLTGTAVKLERRDIFGNSTPVASQEGLFLLALGNVPQYIVASGENVQFELAGQNGLLLDYSPSIVVEPGETLPWQVKVANPFPTPLKGRLTVDGAAPIAVEVAPKSTRPYSVTVRRNGTSGAREMLGLQLESDQLPAPLKGTTEVQTAYVIPAAPNNLSVPMARRGIVSLFEATPMQDLHFKDENDLSATVQAQKTAEGIKIRVTATDQTHFVVAEPNMWWSGDSIQWAIGLPDGQMWEWMGALLPDGPKMVLSLAPDGKTGLPVPVAIRREGNQTIYEWTLPRTLPNGAPMPERFNFNFIVNDNDGQGRKGWIEWTPGIGMEKNPAPFIPLAIQK